MNIKDLENAWRARASESPEEIVEDAIDMAKSNLLSLQRHVCDTMWGKYWYRSGTNQTMKNALLGMFNGDTMVFAESWVQGKLNLADDYIKAVHDYADSENEKGESDASTK